MRPILVRSKLPPAPAHFSASAKALWRSIHRDFELEDDAICLLRVGIENLDLADRARESLRNDGLLVDGKKNPALDAVKLHDGLYLRCMRQLGLDLAPAGKRGGRAAA